MNREQAKKLLPIIQTFAEGKTIQVKASDGLWYDSEGEVNFKADPQMYRIKPESKYRPFKDAEECWQEMQKHQPFGWIKAFSNKYFYSVSEIRNEGCVFSNGDLLSFETLFKFDTFTDGTPFGIKVEKQLWQENLKYLLKLLLILSVEIMTMIL